MSSALAFKSQRYLLIVVSVLLVLRTPLAFAQTALVDSWRAWDLAAFDDGDAVGSWSSVNGRTLTASGTLRPLLHHNVTPAGGPVVRFSQDWLRRDNDSPVGGLTAFSIAFVVRLDQAGSSGTQWYNNAGIVDAEQGGVTADWGIVVNDSGAVGWGVGTPDSTLYASAGGSLVDGKFHAIVCAWGDGFQELNIDNVWAQSLSGSSISPRNDAGLSFGGIHTGEGDANQRFSGDLVEVRFYDKRLSGLEMSNVVQELRGLHIEPGTPIISSFTASTNHVRINSPVTLAWNTQNADLLNIQPDVGVLGNMAGNIIVYPRTNTTYTLTASNSQGTLTREVTVMVDQGVPRAQNQFVRALQDQATIITLTGSDPEGAPLNYSILALPGHGSLSGQPPLVTYTPAPGFAGNDQFTFQVNDGEFDSPPAIVTLQVLPLPAPPSAITITTTNITGSSSPGSFIASFKVIDPNPDDTHTFALTPGFGDNARFVLDGHRLIAGDSFAGKQFLIRVRATDNGGLWTEQTFTLSVNSVAKSIVINEFHYNPSENTVLEEFIELYNPTGSDVDASGWRLDGAVKFTLPPGTLLSAGQFLVIAQDPPTLHTRYGVAALGPWEGGLASEGEEIQLEDANGATLDTVDYKPEFPWPVAADGSGASAALVHPGLDNDLGSSWRPEIPPTPGRINSAFALNAAPNIRQVNQTPRSPTSADEIVITAKVTDPDGVASVILQYQLVAPGDYVPAYLPLPYNELLAAPNTPFSPNPDYFDETNWTSLVMLDNGTGGDAAAGDDVYSMTLPAQGNRVLVRYRIRVTDGAGNARQAPFEDDPSLNFAAFVYDGVPSYEGTSSADLETLPVFTLLSRGQDVIQCTAYIGYQIPQFSGPYSHPARHVFNWRGTLVYNGVVYDHISYRLRGANGRYQPGKRNWRFKFNRGHYLEARDQFGRKFPRKWTHLTTGKGSNNRMGLTFGLNEVANYLLWNKVGVPAPETLFFHFRLVDGPQEAPDKYGGDFWGLNWAQEDYDGAFLDARGLEKGNLYKLINAPFSSDLAEDMVNQQRYQAPFAVSDGTDGAAIQTGLLSYQTSEWIRARVNCQAWFRYHAICEAVRHYDFWPDANKNAAWYFSPPYDATNGFFGQFRTLPWDTDCTWGASWNSGKDLVYAGIFNYGSHPDLVRDYRNTVREIRDLLFQPDQINPMLDALAARIAKFVPADLARWSNAPASGGNYLSMVSAARFATPALTDGVAGQVQDMKQFMFSGGTHVWWIDRQTVPAGGWVTRLDSLAHDVDIPATPMLHYVGQSNYPMNSLTFECLPFADPQGPNTFSAMQWRLAEVRDTNRPPEDPRVIPPMEWDAIWDSGTLSAWTGRITIPGLVVETNRIYRVRVRHQDNTGRWSHWSAPIEFGVTAVDLVSILRENLRITEIMYHPPALEGFESDQLEFLELQNTGTTPLDVGGLTFTAGITFTFPHGTTLNPKQYFLLGRNAGALQTRYPGILVDGIYSGKLDNAGETVRLSTPTGIPILEVTYDDAPPWPVTADGMGWSLVLEDPVRGHYRVSSAAGGSPAQDDPHGTIPGVVINELLTHPAGSQMDWIEIHNPTKSAIDVGGWFLTDDKDVPRKFRISDSTILGAGGYLEFSQVQFDAFGMDFGLSRLGDEVYLFSGDASTNLTGYVHGALPGASAEGVSFGRVVNSLGLEDFAAMSSLTIGTNNSRPRVGPVVISEIMFQPPQVGDTENFDAEFIELQNVTHTDVPLYSTLYPTNTWKLYDAVNYTFPANTILPSGGRLLIVSFDPASNPFALADFRGTYGVSPETVILGPWSGRLGNDGETIELRFPGSPEPDGFVPYILAEKVFYQAAPPWPTSSAGGGHSLQRATLLEYANDPVNWFAGEPTAGALSKWTSDDVDGDGIPDLWEMEHGSDPFKPDADLDPDGDGFDNLAEWQAGTDPWDAASFLRIEAVASPMGGVQLQFHARSGRSYTVQKANSIESIHWTTLTNIAAAPTNRFLTLPQLPTGTHFFRLVTPVQP